MRRLITAASLMILVLAARGLTTGVWSAQLAAPNEMGVAMGHLHYHVRDVAANKKFWVALVPYTKGSNGVATAFLTDPWGTSIELTEGLSRSLDPPR